MKAKLLITSGKLLVTSGTAACLGIMAALMPADVQAAQVNATLSWVTGGLWYNLRLQRSTSGYDDQPRWL